MAKPVGFGDILLIALPSHAPRGHEQGDHGLRLWSGFLNERGNRDIRLYLWSL